MTFRISIQVKSDPTAAVRVSLMDYELDVRETTPQRDLTTARLQATIERERTVVKAHGYVTHLCDEMKDTCQDVHGRMVPGSKLLQPPKQAQATA
jgi:hypothetical protein